MPAIETEDEMPNDPNDSRSYENWMNDMATDVDEIDDEDDLKPCPFCGAPAEFGVVESEDANDGGHFVQCTSSACGASSALLFPLMDDVRGLLIERWNKRHNA